MAISASASTVEVTYFRGTGIPVLDGSQEADGYDYARVAARIADASSQPIPDVQVRIQLDAATPDPTFRATHGIERPNGDGFVSYTGADGIATIDIRSQDASASPLTLNVLAGENDSRISGEVAPTTITAGNTLSTTATISTLTNVTAAGQSYERTLFTAPVTVSALNARFTNCTFDMGGAHPNCVSSNGQAGLIFENCTFTNCTGHAVAGYGYWVNRCHFTDIGFSALSISTTDTTLDTTIDESLLERFGSASASPGIVISPGSRASIRGNKIHGPHENSPGRVTGFEGRGAVWVFTRRPSASSDITISGNWVYGGEDAPIRVQSLDSGNPPAGIRIENNRFGSPAQYQSPAGTLAALDVTAVGLYAAGNVVDETGRLLAVGNTVDGVGWYHAADYIDATPAVSFLEDAGAIATISPRIVSPELSRPTATAVTLFSSPVYVTRSTAQVAIRSSMVPLAPLYSPPAGDQDIETVEGVDSAFYSTALSGTTVRAGSLPGYYDDAPTARVFPPARVGTPAVPDPVVEFASNDQYRTVFETSASVNLTVDLSWTVEEDAVVSVSYAGTAEGGGVDFTAPSTVTIPAGSTTAELTITIVDDEVAESDEIIAVTLDSSTEGVIGVRDTARVRIVNYNDLGVPLAAPSVQMGIQTVVVTESADLPVVDIPVVMSETRGFDVDVDYSVAQTTMEATEYTDLTGGQVTIATGQTEATIQIRIEDDETYEPAQEFIVLAIDAASGSTIIGDWNTATIKVNDEDQEPTAAVGFSIPGMTIFEGGYVDAMVTLSTPVSGTVTVPFTDTPSNGLTGAEYTLTEPVTGAAVTSPLTFSEGKTLQRIRITSLQDTTPEAMTSPLETLTLTLGAATGNASTTGTNTEYVLEIIDDDVSGAGADGDLHGLVPERQTVDLTGYDIDVYPDRYEVQANATHGIAANTVYLAGGQSVAGAIYSTEAQDLWVALNEAAIPGSSVTLQDPANRLVEGEVVRIRINGDCVRTQFDPSTIIGGSDQGDWGDLPVVRDLCIFGATDKETDSIARIYFKTSPADEVASGAFVTRDRIAANIRFERLGIENTSQTCVYSNCNGTLDNSDSDFGAIKFYQCWFKKSRTPSPGTNLERGIRFVVRVESMRAAWDFRGCHFDLPEEHILYMDGILGHLYVINCTHEFASPTSAGGSIRGPARTFAQIVGRLGSPTVPPVPSGTIVMMRNTAMDNVAGPLTANPQQSAGGSDFTFTAFDGDIYCVDNNHIGLSDGPGSGERGCILVYGDIHTGHSLTTQNGTEKLVGSLHIWGDLVDFEDGGSRQPPYQLSGIAEIDVRGFSIPGPLQTNAQFWLDSCQPNLHLIGSLNGYPAEAPAYPDHGFTFDLRWPTWDAATPYSGSPSSYPGWFSGSSQIVSGATRRWAPWFITTSHTLTGAQVDEFDGTRVWETATPSQLPQAGWPFESVGLPVGGSIDIRLGDSQGFFDRSQAMRSVRTQTINFTRLLENIVPASFTQTEVTTSLISFNPTGGAAGTGSGTFTFSYRDDFFNVRGEEVPEMTLDLTGNPVDTSEPGVIRYALDPATASNTTIGIDTFDVYLYHSSGFAEFGWALHPGAAVTLSKADGDTQNVTLTASRATFMRERIDISASNYASGAQVLSSTFWVMPSGTTQRAVQIRNINDAAVGESVTVTIDSVEVNGTTAGTISASPTLTITFTA